MNPQFCKPLCSCQAVPHSPHSSTCPTVPGEWPKLALQALPAAQIHGWAARDECQTHAVWAGRCSVARMCHRCLAACCSRTEQAQHFHSTEPGWHPAGQKSLGASTGGHICSYQCDTKSIRNKIFQQYLKDKARKAESSYSDSRGNS